MVKPEEAYFIDSNFIIITPDESGSFFKKNKNCKPLFVKLVRDTKKKIKFEVEY